MASWIEDSQAAGRRCLKIPLRHDFAGIAIRVGGASGWRCASPAVVVSFEGDLVRYFHFDSMEGGYYEREKH